MSDPHLEDRYQRGELTATEARELAQKSLGDPELFEDLTYSALAKAGLARAPVTKIVRFPRKARFLIAGAAAAAAIVSVVLYSLSSRPHQIPRASVLKPALASLAKPDQPVLLASGLGTERGVTPVFRSTEPDSRAPRPTGSIVSIEDGQVSIDLGSLDGLAKGSELQIFRDQQSSQPIGRLMITTVFRERARGRILSGQGIQVHGQVRVADAAYLSALLDQVDALNTVAVLRLLNGDYAGAEAPLSQAASKAPKTDVTYGRSMNNLGVLAELHGDRPKAEALYTDALRAFANSAEQDRRAVETNLARVRGVR